MKLPAGTVLALEKPFGTDLASARALNRLLATFIPEKQVHRIDHFLGKSTVLNLLGLRFANRLFEESWNASNIERVDINYDEQLGLEGRAGYYDRAGALVDMIQSHLLQVLAVVAMEPPSTLDSDDLRGAMAQALPGHAGLARRREDGESAGSLHGGHGRLGVPRLLRQAAGGRSLEAHRDARGDRLRGRELALGRGAIRAAVGQGARGRAQGHRHHVPLGAASSDRDDRKRGPPRSCASRSTRRP